MKMTIEELEILRNTVTECKNCGFCTNYPPTKPEMLRIIDELIEYKRKEVQENVDKN